MYNFILRNDDFLELSNIVFTLNQKNNKSIEMCIVRGKAAFWLIIKK